jgi:hypothetical protein
MPVSTKNTPKASKGREATKASAPEIAEAIASYRMRNVSGSIWDVTGDLVADEPPFTWDDLTAAVARENHFTDAEGCDADAGYLLGIAVGRRLSGVR